MSAEVTAAPVEHMVNFVENVESVRRLLEIHAELTGSAPGRRTGVEVLHKASVVLLVACWEVFVEELTFAAVHALARNGSSPSVFPATVRARSARQLTKSQDDRELWRLAGDGWRAVLEEYAITIVARFNTPDAEKVDGLFENALGLKTVSQYWRWRGLSAARARVKLQELIRLRGDIAHQVSTSAGVRKIDVRSYTDFVFRLAVKTHNRVGKFVGERLGRDQWPKFSYTGKVR